MNVIVRSFLVALVLVGIAAPSVSLYADDDADAMKNCYDVRGEARYAALGYNHVVIISNRCEVTLKCEVWTDVDPKPRIPLTVGPKATGEAVCRINSPARGFKAFGECKQE